MSSYNSRCRPRSEDENRFVYGRYRHPTQNRHPMHQPHSPHSTHSFGHHSHHGHAHSHASHGAHSSHTHLHQDEEGIYESADHHDRSMVDPRVNARETPDSERYAVLHSAFIHSHHSPIHTQTHTYSIRVVSLKYTKFPHSLRI